MKSSIGQRKGNRSKDETPGNFSNVNQNLSFGREFVLYVIWVSHP